MISDMLNSMFRRKKTTSLSFDEVQIVQLIVQQTVLTVEGLEDIPHGDRSRLACALAVDLLEDMGIWAPASLIETLVEASFRLFLECRARVAARTE